MQYILNADDFGRTETVNQAIAYGFDHHCLDRTTIMVNMPFYDQAVQLAEEHRFKNKVGLHINLTCGKPLSEEIKAIKSFCGENGNFNGKIFKDKRLMLFLSSIEEKAVRTEINMQIEKYLRCGFSLKHADSHGHVHTFPSMQKTVLSCLKLYKFDSVRISANLHTSGMARFQKKNLNRKLVHYNRVRGHDSRYFDSLKNVISNLDSLNAKEGECEVMLHPNIWNGQIKIGENLSFSDIPALLLNKTD